MDSRRKNTWLGSRVDDHAVNLQIKYILTDDESFENTGCYYHTVPVRASVASIRQYTPCDVRKL